MPHAPLLEPLALGSQYYIGRGDTPASVHAGLRAMAAARLRYVRLFLLWDLLEPKEGQWDWSTYDAAFDAAAEFGLLVVPTLMSISPPGWMGISGGSQDIGPLEDEAFLKRSEEYVHRVVQRWRNHPALHSWILWNEPSRVPPRNTATRSRFREFLHQRYDGDVDRLNATRYAQVTDFADVAVDSGGVQSLAFRGYGERLDWIRFAVADLHAHLARLAALVRADDPNHPIHTNPHNVAETVLAAGQSVFRQRALVDFMGCSAHPTWHATRFPRDRWGTAIGLFADLMRATSPHPEGLFWVSELQGGPTLFSAERADGPDGPEITRWIWEGFAAGARAVVFWCFNARHSGYEAGEWRLLGLDGLPSRRLQAVTAVADFLAGPGAWLNETRPLRPTVLVLRSEDAEALTLMDDREPPQPSNPRNPTRTADAVAGAYLLFADLGLEVGFIDEPGLQGSTWKSTTRLLILPGPECVAEQTWAAIDDWVRAGGTVWADGLTGWKTAEGDLADSARVVQAQLFGSALIEAEPVRPAETDLGDDRAAWFLRGDLLPAPSTEVLLRWVDGTPAATRVARGQGSAIRLGTCLTQRYLTAPSVAWRNWLSTLLPIGLQGPVHLAQPGPSIRLRRLWHPEGEGLIIIGPPDAEIALSISLAGNLHPAAANSHPVAADSIWPARLDSHGLWVARWSRE